MDRKKSIFDKIGSLITGYSGYAEREGRRSTDKILRENIVGELIEIERILYKRMNTALKNKDADLLKDLDEVRKNVNTFISQVKYAPYGVSGFFADAQIKEDELLKIYQMDLQLAENIQSLKENIAEMTISIIQDSIESNQELVVQRNTFISEFK